MDIMNYFTKQKKRNINLNDFNDFINDDHKHYKITSNKNDDKLDEVKENYKIPHIKASNIKDFDNLPEKVDKYKIREINQKEFNNEFMGFDDPLLNYKGTRKIDNAYLYGEPSSKELMISNLQTESGTNNKLNDKLLSIETGESIEDIKDANQYVDNERNEEIDKILNAIENEPRITKQNKLNKELEILKENKKIDKAKYYENEKTNKALIKPIIEYNKDVKSGNEFPNKRTTDIIEDDRIDKQMAKAEKEGKASHKIQKAFKNVKAKKEGKQMIKNIVDDINTKLRHQDMMDESIKKVKQIKKDKIEHKEKLNEVFDEVKKKFTKKDKVVNYNKIFPVKKNKKIDYTINPLIKMPEQETKSNEEPETKRTEEPQKRTRGRPKKDYTSEELAKKLEATRSSDRIRKANKREAAKQSKK